MQEIRVRGLTPIQIRRKVRLRWTSLVAAAAVIIAVGLTTAVLLRDIVRQQGQGGQVAGGETIAPRGIAGFHPTPTYETLHTPPHPVQRPSLADLQNPLPSRDEVREFAARWRGLLEPMAELAQDVLDSGSGELAVLMAPGGLAESEQLPFAPPPVLTYPVNIIAPFKTFKADELKLPLFLDIRDLETAKLLDRLTAGEVHYLDLACGDGRKSFERLHAACRSVGIKLVVDPELKERIDKKVPTVYMIYVENVPADKLVKLLQAIHAEERKAEAKQKGDIHFGSIMVQPLDNYGKRRLAESLGVHPRTLVPAKPEGRKGPLGVDPTQPISNETVKALEKLAAGQGGSTAPGEPTAIAMVYYPNRYRVPPSNELRQFLQQRKGWRAEMVHAVLLLRPTRFQ